MMSILWYFLLATFMSNLAAGVKCPDGGKCPDGSTCCRMASGKFGCCPFPKAVCCTDGQHCCPFGYICNDTSGKCIKGSHSIPWAKKEAHQDANLTEHIGQKCPDGSSCSVWKTCCRLQNGTYGCCPFQHAVCCKDRRHCCPQGHICNLQTLMCDIPSSLSWSSTFLAKAVEGHLQKSPVNETNCSCPHGGTSCQGPQGDCLCCLLPNAVCCADQQYCCPSGSSCNPETKTCDKDVKLLSLSPGSTTPWNVVCSNTTSCRRDFTCCPLAKGHWACCPFPEVKMIFIFAFCCADRRHCCPKGYVCNQITRTCSKHKARVPWAEKVPVEISEIPHVDLL
uniref:progranulin-like n=1 Tax=Myxine glutinosa TaxID=7769 RepID=UPI00358FB333